MPLQSHPPPILAKSSPKKNEYNRKVQIFLRSSSLVILWGLWAFVTWDRPHDADIWAVMTGACVLFTAYAIIRRWAEISDSGLISRLSRKMDPQAESQEDACLNPSPWLIIARWIRVLLGIGFAWIAACGIFWTCAYVVLLLLEIGRTNPMPSFRYGTALVVVFAVASFLSARLSWWLLRVARYLSVVRFFLRH